MPTDIGDSITAGGVAGRTIAIFVLLALNALFVLAEYVFAAVSSDHDEQQQSPITAIRVGSSFASVGVGVLAGPYWFVAVALLHLIAASLAPMAVATDRPDAIGKWVIPIMKLFSKLLTPVVWIVNHVTNALLRSFGIEDGFGKKPAHTTDQLRTLVMNAHARGSIEESDRAMLAGVFDFKQKRANDVMRPRTEIVAIDIDSTEEEVREIIKTERFSRYPVFRESLDDVVGVFLAKDLWLRDETQKFELSSHVREALYVPDSRPAARILDDLQRTRAYMAVILDEYGGTAGIITVEDLVEEVMGDITDEYDSAARTALELDGVLELAGSLSLIDARSDYELDIPEGEWTTLGGFAFSQLGRLPKVGDRVSIPEAELEVVAMDGRRVAALRVHKNPTITISELAIAQ